MRKQVFATMAAHNLGQAAANGQLLAALLQAEALLGDRRGRALAARNAGEAGLPPNLLLPPARQDSGFGMR